MRASTTTSTIPKHASAFQSTYVTSVQRKIHEVYLRLLSLSHQVWGALGGHFSLKLDLKSFTKFIGNVADFEINFGDFARPCGPPWFEDLSTFE